MENTSILERHKRLVLEVIEEEYFLDIFLKACDDTGYSQADDKANTALIHRLWSGFWFMLPDHPYIRTRTFTQMCNLLEDIESEYNFPH